MNGEQKVHRAVDVSPGLLQSFDYHKQERLGKTDARMATAKAPPPKPGAGAMMDLEPLDRTVSQTRSPSDSLGSVSQ